MQIEPAIPTVQPAIPTVQTSEPWPIPEEWYQNDFMYRLFAKVHELKVASKQVLNVLEKQSGSCVNPSCVSPTCNLRKALAGVEDLNLPVITATGRIVSKSVPEYQDFPTSAKVQLDTNLQKGKHDGQ